MKSIIKKGSSKLGGLIFKHSNITSMPFHDWVDAGCPPNSYIQGLPDQLIICGIPIVDGIVNNGCFYKCEPKERELCKWKVPSYMARKDPREPVITTVDGIEFFDPAKKNQNNVMRYGK